MPSRRYAQHRRCEMLIVENDRRQAVSRLKKNDGMIWKIEIDVIMMQQIGTDYTGITDLRRGRSRGDKEPRHIEFNSAQLQGPHGGSLTEGPPADIADLIEGNRCSRQAQRLHRIIAQRADSRACVEEEHLIGAVNAGRY